MGIYMNEGKKDWKNAPLSAEQAAQATGGVLYMFHDLDKWEVIDDETGEVLARFDRPDLEEAKKYAREHGQKDAIVYWTYVCDIRKRYEIYGPKNKE